MEMLWFWPVAEFSVSPAGMCETSKIGHSNITMEVGHA